MKTEFRQNEFKIKIQPLRTTEAVWSFTHLQAGLAECFLPVKSASFAARSLIILSVSGSVTVNENNKDLFCHALTLRMDLHVAAPAVVPQGGTRKSDSWKVVHHVSVNSSLIFNISL